MRQKNTAAFLMMVRKQREKEHHERKYSLQGSTFSNSASPPEVPILHPQEHRPQWINTLAKSGVQ